MNTPLPARVLTWYGDDFTGSTDVLEAVAPHLPAVLFLKRPDTDLFARFAHYAAFGLAGSSRSQSPAWMDEQLPADFAWLQSLGAGLCHYKVCSTFDSSPDIGNIGRAMELGRRAFGSRFVPLLVGAPSLRRYTFGGQLFAAAADGEVYRIDRHPAMRCHPVTPMHEADLRLHLAAQTHLRVGLHAPWHAPEPYAATTADAVLIDVFDDPSLARAGRLLWSEPRQPFVVGSSGVEYALLAAWDAPTPPPATAAPVPQLAVLSGSCSPATARQIHHAAAHGFAPIPIHPTNPADDEATLAQALQALADQAPGVVLHTSRDAQDRVPHFTPQDRQHLGERAGRLLARLLAQTNLRRAVIAGGDTSSHAGRQLGLDALTFIAHLAPGAPLCQAWSSNAAQPGLEVVFKGGQCGRDDFFTTVKNGKDTITP